MTPIDHNPRCAGCKYHSVEVREIPVRLNADGGELGLCDHEERTAYTCKHPDQTAARKEQGFWPVEGDGKEPGLDCALFLAGKKGVANPELERLLAASAARAERDERRGQ